MGFVISSNELNMDLEKVREIKEWNSPMSVSKVIFIILISTVFQCFSRKHRVILQFGDKSRTREKMITCL
jgi:hypothetical protein